MARRKTIKPVDLSSAVEELLKEYGDEVFEVLDDAITDTTSEAVSDLHAVRTFSPKGNPSGAYSSSWTSEEKMTSRYSKNSTVYNENHYRLTHLLESGHSKVLWGRKTGERVSAYPHIAPINEKAQESVIRKVEKGIESL